MTPAPAPVVRISATDDPARLAALREEWFELFDAAGEPNPFLSWEWLFTWWRHFGQRRALRLLEARDSFGRLAGVVALCGAGGPGGDRRWRLLGNGVTGADALDVLARPGLAGSVRCAVAAALAGSIGDWDALDLEDLPCGSPTVAVLRAALEARGARASVERRFACPAFALRGSFAEHLKRLRRRETYGRRVRWLERQPGFGVDVAATRESAPAAMEDFLRLHRLRWEAEGGSYGIPPGACEDFHRDVAPLLAARGWLRLYRLRVGGRALAAVYGIEMGRRFYFYQSGFDPEWSARSPGIVLLGRTVEDAYAGGLTDYEFLRGEEPYKLDWADARRELCALRLRAPGLRAVVSAAAEDAWRVARKVARGVAPERVWSALARARRHLALNGVGRAPVGGAMGEAR